MQMKSESTHITLAFVQLKTRCFGNPSTSPRPWKCRDSKSGVINVTHANPQLHHDQSDCHFLFLLTSTDWCQQSFILLLPFDIVPNLGLFVNHTFLKRKLTRVCDNLDEVAGYHWRPKWVENRIPSSSRVMVMYLDFQSIDFVGSANYRMVWVFQY